MFLEHKLVHMYVVRLNVPGTLVGTYVCCLLVPGTLVGTYVCCLPECSWNTS